MKARLASLLFVAAFASPLQSAESARPLVVVGRIDTPIHPAAANYLKGLLSQAERDGASLVVIELSTPGGLLSSTREMTTAILLSKVPVATFVTPSGASAASAGFFLLEAGDFAAMAPGTNTGAAHPVGAEGAELSKTLNEKAEQDARAFIRTLASQRHRNAEKAEAAVTASASYTETEAKAAGLIETVARDVPDLVAQIDGLTLARVGGPGRKSTLGNARIVTREMGQIDKILGVVSHPNVTYLLFLLGLAGLYFELSTPGAILPGVVGGIAILLALYGFSVLPVNLAAVGLILFGIGLFLVEVKVSSHGVLAVGGAVAVAAGSMLLFSRPGETNGYRVDTAVFLPGLLVLLAVVGSLTWKTIALRRMPVRTGADGMIGQPARVAQPFAGGTGEVFVQGEYWGARGPSDLAAGEEVRIVKLDGLTLVVERRI